MHAVPQVVARDRAVDTVEHSTIEAHLPLVHAAADRFGSSMDLDDARQVGALALCQAAVGFDGDRDVSFGAYAKPRVVGAIRRAAGKERRWQSTHCSQEEDLPPEVLTDPCSCEAHDVAASREARTLVRRFLSGLSSRQRAITERVVGREECGAHVADELGITRQAVSRTVKTVLARGAASATLA